MLKNSNIILERVRVVALVVDEAGDRLLLLATLVLLDIVSTGNGGDATALVTMGSADGTGSRDNGGTAEVAARL